MPRALGRRTAVCFLLIFFILFCFACESELREAAILPQQEDESDPDISRFLVAVGG